MGKVNIWKGRGDSYLISSNTPIIETRGRKQYDESELVRRYIVGRLSGEYKGYSDGAHKLLHDAGKHTGCEVTKFDRLRRKFSKGWKQHDAGEMVDVK